MTFYMTTEGGLHADNNLCAIWHGEPQFRSYFPGSDQCTLGTWDGNDACCILALKVPSGKRAALGFPKPGKCRVVEIPPCEEEADDNA